MCSWCGIIFSFCLSLISGENVLELSNFDLVCVISEIWKFRFFLFVRVYLWLRIRSDESGFNGVVEESVEPSASSMFLYAQPICNSS